MINKISFLTVIFAVLSLAEQPSKPTESAMPQLQILQRKQKAPSDSSSDSVKITSDSAVIISPAVRTIIAADSVEVKIVPRCPVDSVMIWVTHSDDHTDTLDVCNKPPYQAIWNCSKYPDQDQLHLKFGYTLFHSSGIKIICPPLAHRWIIDRNGTISRKKHHCRFTNQPERIKIDGDFSDWKKVKGTRLNNTGTFKCLWTGTHLLLSAAIIDSSVTESDLLELHFDIYHNREGFSGINHRNIQYNPLTRSNCMTVHLTGSGFTLNDSVNVLLSREMQWKKKITPEGYSIETSIPFFALSDIQYAPAEIGFDISVVNKDRGVPTYKFTSWSGSTYYNRFNPSEWGTMALHQAMFPLQLAIFIGLFFFFLLIVTAVITVFYQLHGRRKFELSESKGYSEFMNRILTAIHKEIAESSLDLPLLAERLSTDPDTVEETIRKETGRSFHDYLEFLRIRSSRASLKDLSLPIIEAARRSGYSDETVFRERFKAITGSTPEDYRLRIGKEMEEDEE